MNNKLKTTITTYESNILEIMSAVAPWLAPIPSAYLVGRAVVDELNWHIAIGIIAAIAVEAVGIVSITNALRLYEWNASKRKKDPAAPTMLAYTAVFIYFAVTIMLTILLESFPQLAHIAPAIFPVLAAVGSVNIAIRNSQNRREKDVTVKHNELSMKGRETAVKRKLATMKGREEKLNARETAVKLDEAAIAKREAAVKGAEPRLAEIEIRETAVIALETAMQKMNPLAQDIIYMIGGREDTGTRIAARHKKSTGYVSALKAKMNGTG